MKKIIVLLNAILLLLCINACEPTLRNKGHFEKNIPKCLKQTIMNDYWIRSVKEYCTENGAKKIYYIDDAGRSWAGNFLTIYDENCNAWLMWTEENPPRPAPNDWFDDSSYTCLLSDGTIRHESELYYFKRIVFTQKKKK